MASDKRWVVLVGGGGCGRWQAGALFALERAGLLSGIDGIVGTSVGGLNACVLALGISRGLGAHLLMAAWQKVTKDEDIYSPSIMGLVASPWTNIWSLLGVARRFIWGDGALDRSALEKFVADVLGDATTDDIMAKRGIKLLTRAYNYKLGQVHSLTGRLQDMALATSAIEGAFPSWQGYGDGGAGDNMPVDIALAHGAKQILVVYCGPEKASPLRDPVVLGQVGKQTHTTGLANVLAVAAHLTEANEDLVDQAAEAARAQGVQIVDCYPAADTGNFLDFRERGLWDRGVAEAWTAIQAAKALGW